jgi:hypothetical protein
MSNRSCAGELTWVGHLRRFNVFQIPSNPQPSRGIRTWNGDLRDLRPRPTPLIPAVPRRPPNGSVQAATSSSSTHARVGRFQDSALPALPVNVPVLPRSRVDRQVTPTGFPSPGVEGVVARPKMIPPDRPPRTKRPPTDNPGRQIPSQKLVPAQAAAIKAPIATDPPTRPKLSRPPTDRPVRQMSSTGIVPAQAGGVIAPVQNDPLVSSPIRLSTPATGRSAPRFRSTPESRRAERAKLLQHRFVLEQQAEKRWRIAMDFMVTKMLIFEAEHTYVFTDPVLSVQY